jgi:hypothetical protein
MKTTLTFAAILLLLAGSFSCGKEEENENTSLKGTKWQMECFVDTQTGSTIEAEPKCDMCYYFIFDTDNTASGRTVINDLYVSLNPVFMKSFSKGDDSENGTAALFYEAIGTVDSYNIENNTMKFFYNDNKNYLLFKLIKL